MISDEELAKVSADVDLGYGLHHTQARRLIAALRASQERVLELEGQLYDSQLENDDLRSQ